MDGDDAAQFGPAQYSEADVVAPRAEGTLREQKEREALREAVISPHAPHTPHTPPEQPHGAQIEVKPEPGTPSRHHEGDEIDATSTVVTRDSDAPVVEALRARIRELEAEMRVQPFKCLICMVSLVRSICRFLSRHIVHGYFL